MKSFCRHSSQAPPRYPGRAGEGVALGAWPGELLEVRDVVYHDAILLVRDGPGVANFRAVCQLRGLLHLMPYCGDFAVPACEADNTHFA